MLGSIVERVEHRDEEKRCARNALLIFSLRASTWSLVIEGWRETARATILRAITSLTWDGAGGEREISREVPPLLLDFHHRLAKRPWSPLPAVPHDSPPERRRSWNYPGVWTLSLSLSLSLFLSVSLFLSPSKWSGQSTRSCWELPPRERTVTVSGFDPLIIPLIVNERADPGNCHVKLQRYCGGSRREDAHNPGCRFRDTESPLPLPTFTL